MMFQLSLNYGSALFKDLSLATLFADGGEVISMENKVYDSEAFNWGGVAFFDFIKEELRRCA